MTAVICAAKEFDGQRTCVMASDSLFSLGLRRLKLKDPSKIIQFPNFTVGFAGLAASQTVIYEFRRSTTFLKKPFTKMRHQWDALEFARQVYADLKIRMEAAGDTNVFDAAGDLIIATQSSIYQIDKYDFAQEIETHTAIGCADEICISYIDALYDSITSSEQLEQVCRKAIEVAIDRNSGCGGEVKSFII